MMLNLLFSIIALAASPRQDIVRIKQMCRDIQSLDTAVQASSVKGFKNSSSDIVDRLIPLLQHDTLEIRSGAAVALGLFPGSRTSIIPALSRALGDTNNTMVIALAASLSELVTPADSQLVPILVRKIRSMRWNQPNSSALFYLVSSVGRIGRHAEPAIPTLEGIMRSRRVSSATQAEASKALERIRGR